MTKKPDGKPAAEEEPESILGYIRTHTDCPGCGDETDFEGDVSGETFKCVVCGTRFIVREVR